MVMYFTFDIMYYLFTSYSQSQTGATSGASHVNKCMCKQHLVGVVIIIHVQCYCRWQTLVCSDKHME